MLSIFSLTICMVQGSEFRTFTSADGVEIEAKLVEISRDGKVTITDRNGEDYDELPLELFSMEDRRYIREWEKKQQELIDNADVTSDSPLRISFLKGRDDDMNDYGDIDDRIVTFEPEVVIENQDYKRTFRDISGTVVTIGQGILGEKEYVILDKQKFNLTARPREKGRWTGIGFECRYDPDYGGFEYGGYLIVLRNRAGEIVMTKGSRSVWERDPERILNAKRQVGYDSDFSKRRKLFSTFGLPR
ncbi:MAG: hypothetical protein AAGH40_00870 [Verrucomicrobiota bacterium]